MNYDDFNTWTFNYPLNNLQQNREFSFEEYEFVSPQDSSEIVQEISRVDKYGSTYIVYLKMPKIRFWMNAKEKSGWTRLVNHFTCITRTIRYHHYSLLYRHKNILLKYFIDLSQFLKLTGTQGVYIVLQKTIQITNFNIIMCTTI